MNFLNQYTSIEVSLLELVRNLGVGLIIAIVWAYVISKSTRLLVDTRQYLPIFLLLIPSMILIISIIKSSIALSLGLVGALSIVRFRTPIKEPEELLYLFVAIAVGLGLGAGQITATVLGFSVVCLSIFPFYFFNKETQTKNTYVDISMGSANSDSVVGDIRDILNGAGFGFDMKRISSSKENLEILLEVTNFDLSKFSSMETEIKKISSDAKIVVSENARIIT